MKALSVRRPWAPFIAKGIKQLELRTWITDYRGPLLICSGTKLWVSDGREPLVDDQELALALAAPGGIATTLVQLVDIRPVRPSDARRACIRPNPGEFAWVLRDPRPMEPVPIVGRLKLFDVDWPALLAAHRRTIEAGQ